MNSKAKEPSTAPPSEQWFPLSLGSSFTDDPSTSSSRFYSLRYEFKPASIDTTRPGTLLKNTENKVTVEFCNNQAGKPKVSFQGNSEDCRDLDGVIFFDGKSFRLERLHKAVKSLRHVRLPGESSNASNSNASVMGSGGASAMEPAISPGHLNGASIPSSLSSIPSNVSVERINPLVQTEEIHSGQVTQTETPVEKKAMKRKSDTTSTTATAKVIPKGRISPPTAPIESPLPPPQAPSIETKMNDYTEDVHVEIETNEDDERLKKTKALESSQHEVNIEDEIVSDYEMIEDVDVSEDDEGMNAAEVLRAQAQAQAQAAADQKQESSSGESSGSGSGSSGSESGSESGSGSSSSGSGSDDDDDSASSAEDI